MAFWRSETMRERIPVEHLVDPYHETHVTKGAYEMCMGPEAFITSTADKAKIVLTDGQSLVIPPGQFALLLTEERVKIPSDAIGFISMRFGVKRRGLINVSGFHVDPGFEGRLKFSVYNAGSTPITINRGDRVFLIWFANLDETTADLYGQTLPDQNIISSDDQNVMHGEIASPAELKSQIVNLEHSITNLKLILSILVTIAVGLCMRLLFMDYFAVPDSDDINRLRDDIMIEVREELSEFEEMNAPPTVPVPAANDATIND